MWLLGLVVGLILGSLFGAFLDMEELSLLGGIAGLAVGLWYSHKHPKPKSFSDSRLDRLESRVNDLESQLDALKFSVSQQGQHTTQAAPVQTTKPFTATEKIKPIATETPAKIASAELPPSTERKPAFQYDAPPVTQTPPNKILQWLLSGEHTIAAIGVVILFIGIGFLVKYAAEHAMFPIELRLASAVLAGIALLAVGWRLRTTHTAYALTLQGGGTGILYLTVYGAFQVWHLIPAGLAFPLMIGIAVLSTLLAVWQNTMALAVFGVTGGFLAPLLTATDSGNHVALFSYYAILNLGIFTAAWFKSWRVLNLLGFVFTFVIALLWGTQNYRPELFASTEPFLLLFFLMYVGIALLYVLKRAPDLTSKPITLTPTLSQRERVQSNRYASLSINDYVDGGLIFGVPVVGFGLQAALVSDFEYGLAISSLVMGAFYMALCWFIQRQRRDDLRLLVESFLALGVIFASLVIPLACDAQWTSAAWAVEGAGIFWFGSRQNKRAAWGFGLLLQAGAGVAFMFHATTASLPANPLNHLLMGAVLLSLSGFVCYCAALQQQTNPKLVAWIAPLFLWGLAWWLYGGLDNIHNYAVFDYQTTLSLLFLTATALICSFLALRWKWPHGDWPMLAFTAMLWLAALTGIENHGHPFAHFGWLAWSVALAAHYWMLRHHETDQSLKLHHVFHTWSFLLLAALGAWEMHWLSGEYQLQHNAWSVASLIAVPVLLLVAVSRPSLEKFWPLSRHLDAFRQQGALPVVIALWLWTFYANLTHDGSSQPLPYLPLLNAIDLGHGLVMLSVWSWVMQIRSTPLFNQQFILRAGGVTLFIWLNAILLRTLHHWAGVAYQFDALMSSVLVQTALSLFWTLLAMAMMITAARRHLRPLWISGATLMGIVLIKLLLVDLSQSGTLERIVSFTGVGVLMLLIGYFAPFPKQSSPDETLTKETP